MLLCDNIVMRLAVCDAEMHDLGVVRVCGVGQDNREHLFHGNSIYNVVVSFLQSRGCNRKR